ncbi:serine hydrolase domain-containing protein [Rhizobacter sp. LjRoot28]|uniref:serine hydrolase domain-containing protein n=1 Tax=Rhizobacter sp. LjRoot28 TaxID=3342309 RepID=UPI003ED09485
MSPTATLPPAPPEALGISPERLARLDAALEAEIARGRLPGAVVTIARRGRMAHFKAYGRLDPAHDAPMQPDSIFRIYSMTKPVVSVALMMLVEQGRLLLTQPASTWLPEFASPQVLVDADGEGRQVPATRPITVHDLLRHTAGLTYHFMGSAPIHQAYASARLFARGLTSADFSRTLAGLPLISQPGACWAYSHATDVVGRIVEVVTGRTLGEYLRTEIFEPLGMIDTAFHVAPVAHHRIAEPYRIDPDAGVPVSVFDVRQPPAHEMGGAGLTSTAADYACFMEMMLSGGVLGGVRLLGPKTVRLMTSDHLGSIPVAGELLAPGHGFGLGFAVRLQDGIAPGSGSAGQFFWAGLAGTSFFVDPREQLHAQLLIQQPGRRDYYRQLFRELVYAALVD